MLSLAAALLRTASPNCKHYYQSHGLKKCKRARYDAVKPLSITESVNMNEAVTMNAQPVRSVILLSMQMYDDTVLESQRRTNVSMLRVSVELIFG